IGRVGPKTSLAPRIPARPEGLCSGANSDRASIPASTSSVINVGSTYRFPPCTTRCPTASMLPREPARRSNTTRNACAWSRISNVVVERWLSCPVTSKLATPPMPLTAPWSNADRLVNAPVGSSATSTSRNLIDELPLLMTRTCISTLKSHAMRQGVVSHRASPSDARLPPHPTSCLPVHWYICQQRQHCCISPGERTLAGLFSDSVACHARLQSLDPEAPARRKN